MQVPLATVLERAGEYFMGRSPIHSAALRLAETLREMEIPFAIAGALCANVHGHVRTTEDVNVLITRDGLERFKLRWLGRGWVERFPGSRGLRDAVTGVPIDLLISGDFPGDGRPKPVAFPHPDEAAQAGADGIPYLRLEVLLELKLASGMTAPHRPRDLDDVIQLIRRNELPRDLALHPYVQAKYGELWEAAQVEDLL